MAQRTNIIIVDDLTDETLPEGQGQTVTFGLDGTSYELDLSKDNADQLREDFKRYVDAARKVSRSTSGGSRRSTASSGGRKDTAAIREWAKANGHEVSERGRIASSVREAYDAAN